MEAAHLIYGSFAGFAVIQRILEAARYPLKRGAVKARWTLMLMSAAHAVCFAGAPSEWFINGRAVSLRNIFFGAILFLAGWLLRKSAIKALRGYWSLNIEIREDQPLVAAGPYSRVRHPNYLAILLEVSGYLLFYAAWRTGILCVLMYGPALFFRIRLEELELERKFGGAYKEYRKKTPLLIPRPARAP